MAWIAIETLLRQTVRPSKMLLVLSKDEFPDEAVPRRIRRQMRRGLEILWTEKTAGSYDKLIPVRKAYPHATIVTFDDDKFFPPTLLEELFDASLDNPDSVIGSRGWVMRKSDGRVRYGSHWIRASGPVKGLNVITPGGNGCLYPPTALDPFVDDLETALQICPTADDIWFWFAAHTKGTPILCLGMKPHRSVQWQRGTPALSEINSTRNDEQFQNMVNTYGLRGDHFGGK